MDGQHFKYSVLVSVFRKASTPANPEHQDNIAKSILYYSLPEMQ
jgi:hypothetical protein